MRATQPIERLVARLKKLPGIGEKSATRLAYHLLGAPDAEVESLLDQALRTARSQQARSLELRAAADLARLWMKQGKEAEARDLLSPVYARFTEGLDTHDLQEAKAVLARHR